MCVRCRRRPPARDDNLCAVCILDLAHEAATAYDDIRHRDRAPDPRLHPDRLISQALLALDMGHLGHDAPHVGCPFCVAG